MKAILRIPGVGEFESLEGWPFSVTAVNDAGQQDVSFCIEYDRDLPDRVGWVDLDLVTKTGEGQRHRGRVFDMRPHHSGLSIVDVTVLTVGKPTPLPAVITSNELPEYEVTVTLRRTAPSVEAFMEKVKWILGDAKTARFDITVGEGRQVDKDAKPGDRAGSDQRI